MWNKGIRYRKNYNKIPGKPDIAIPRYKIAIFCDGEFFHGKDWETLKQKLENSNNSAYWINKISMNRERDEAVNIELQGKGWTVFRFWGKDIKNQTDECVEIIMEAISLKRKEQMQSHDNKI